MDRAERRSHAKALTKALHKFMRDLVGLRDEQGLSQEKVAAMMGISQSAISKLEHYDSNPTLSTIRRYALAVGADVQIIVTPHDYSKTQRVSTVGWASARMPIEDSNEDDHELNWRVHREPINA